MSSNPLVTIITPIFKVDEYFLETVKSITIQSYTNIEWIIITDNTQIKKIDSLIEPKNNIDLKIIISENLNTGYRRNIGINKARGKYTMFIDSDDYLYSKESIAKLVAAMEIYSYKAVGSSCLIKEEDRGYLYRKDLMIYESKKNTFNTYQNESGFYRFIFNTAFLKSYCYFNERFRFEDSLFLVYSLIKLKEFFLISDITYVYRKNHKKTVWNDVLYEEHLDGVFELLDLSIEHNYDNLKDKILKNIWNTNLYRVPDKISKKLIIIQIKSIMKLCKRINYICKVKALLNIFLIIYIILKLTSKELIKKNNQRD